MQNSGDTIALPGFDLDLAQSLLRDASGAEVRLRPQSMAVLQLRRPMAFASPTPAVAMGHRWSSNSPTI